MNSTIIVQNAQLEHAQSMEDLIRAVYEVPADVPIDDLGVEQFRSHIEIFPEGQFVALDTATNGVVGTSTNMLMQFDLSQPFLKPWLETVDDGWLTTHDPNGEWLYGAETSVHADYRGMGIGRQLTDVRLELVRAYNLRGMVAGSAIIDYHKVADEVSAEQYWRDVVAGRRYDTNLTKQLKMGFEALALLPGYVPGEPWTLGYGVTIVWHNPDYREGAQPHRTFHPRPHTFQLRPRRASVED
jgi:GNAT superfamily N-acetyltransferase